MSNKIVRFSSLIYKAFTEPTPQRPLARYRLLATLAKRWGFRLYHFNVRWYDEDEFASILNQFPAGGGLTAKRYNLYYLAKSVAHLKGDTAECGVATGITTYIIHTATKNSTRMHHAFDSFEGISAPEVLDSPEQGVEGLNKGDYAVDESTVHANLSNLRQITLYKGWIPERFGDVSEQQFVFVHIDVDLYRPTLDSLQFFYSRTVPGGMIICDDYGYTGTPGAQQAMDEFLTDKAEPLIRLDAGHALIIKQ